jgi:hypothetical protein
VVEAREKGRVRDRQEESPSTVCLPEKVATVLPRDVPLSGIFPQGYRFFPCCVCGEQSSATAENVGEPTMRPATEVLLVKSDFRPVTLLRSNSGVNQSPVRSQSRQQVGHMALQIIATSVEVRSYDFTEKIRLGPVHRASWGGRCEKDARATGKQLALRLQPSFRN